MPYPGGSNASNPNKPSPPTSTETTKAQEAAKALAESGITLRDPGVLDRTVANIKSGKSAAPTSQLNPEQRLQLLTAQYNDQVRRGDISPAQYQQRIESLERSYEVESGARTMEFGKVAAVKGRSETAKQDEARAIAAAQGVAIGTVDKSGKANLSANSIEFKNRQVSEFAQAQKNQMAQQAILSKQEQQKDERVTVIIPGDDPRTFKDLATAEKFIKRTEGSYLKEVQGPRKETYLSPYVQTAFYTFDDLIGPKRDTPIAGGSLEFIYGSQTKIAAEREPGNILQNFGASLYNTLRYYDLVEAGEIKKPEGLAYLPYYSSKGLSVLYNIPLNLMGDTKTTPTLSDTAFDTGYQLVTKGKTTTHDPIGDYIRKDPIGTLVQLPAEALLWKTGSKTIEYGSKFAKAYSPIRYESKKILTSEGTTSSIIRSITISGKPVVSVQEGTIVKGFNPAKIPYEKINVATREGFEASLGSGIEKSIFYSPKALSSQVSRGIIPDIAKTRAEAWVSGVEQSRGIVSKGGLVGETPFEGLTAKQTKSIFDVTKAEQKNIEEIHGSLATRAAVPESIQKEAGSALLPKDIDIIPKGKNLPKTADELIQKYARSFPLEPGQKLRIKNLGGKEDDNRALELIGKTESIESGQTVYHGTTLENASRILKEGFRFDKSLTSEGTIFAGATKEESYSHLPGLLKITLKKDVKVFDVNLQKDPMLPNDVLRRMAREGKYDIIKNMMQGFDNEIEIINIGAIKTVESVKNITGKWTNPNLKTIGSEEPRKIVEVVLRKSEESKYGIGKGDRILNVRIPSKPTKLKDWGVKIATGDYQLLTNVKQALAYQKGTTTTFDIYTSSGRSKDIVRGYWNLRGKAVFAGGEKGERLTKQAEYIRSLYPGLDWGKAEPEKILLYSSKIGKAESQTSLSRGIAQTPKSLVPKPGDRESKIEDRKTEEDMSMIQSSTTSRSRVVSIGRSITTSRLNRTPSLLGSKYVARTNSLLGSSRFQKPSGSSRMPSRKDSIREPPSRGSSVREPPRIFGPPPSTKLPPSLGGPPSLKNPPTKIPPARPPTITLRPPQNTKITRSFTSRKPAAPIIFDLRNTTKKVPGVYEKGHDFLGWTRVAEIGGARTTKKDIDVGDTRTARLYKEDLLNTKRRYKKSDRKNTLSLKKPNSKFSLF